ncbi:class I SAM-dependent methyltransferase [Granulicella sp. 5B5]|uniref:class I SAM-dependent methyltransferase n=1 Tax=Granulicella sp. 5B5 TaxID=1617967 RepID=UPI0015F49A13|nr:class I SAM-dependent methyltransferase [Granulicella sp. 5B5]
MMNLQETLWLGRLRARLISNRRVQQAEKSLTAKEAYPYWASTYSTETATSFLDEELARKMLRGLPHRHLLDAGCGTGRRIANNPHAVGVDLSPAMLAAGGASNVIEGDIRSMPFEAERFEMVWSRLVIGHIPDPQSAYDEFARVTKPGGYVFVTDFHPDAAHAGHQRSFTDANGTLHAIEHYVHTDHVELARRVGLSLVEHQDGAVGPSVREFYVRGIGIKAYRRDEGLKLVVAYLFQKLTGQQTMQ